MDQKNDQAGNVDWVIRSVQPGGIERIEAWFGSHGYDPHRHDTYSIGRTLAGVQSFHYAGSLRHGVPGNTLVLHPDELHDGMAGTDAGFRYRMAYVDPALIQNILGGEPLPFIAGGISSDPRLFHASASFVQAVDQPLETLEDQDALFDLAMALRAVRGQATRAQASGLLRSRARQSVHPGTSAFMHYAGDAGACQRARTLEPVTRLQNALRYEPLPVCHPAPPGSVPRIGA